VEKKVNTPDSSLTETHEESVLYLSDFLKSNQIIVISFEAKDCFVGKKFACEPSLTPRMPRLNRSGSRTKFKKGFAHSCRPLRLLFFQLTLFLPKAVL
jgi:hypothetical protein